MEGRAKEHGKEEATDIYLNAGLIAGKAKDLLEVIQALDIHPEEDDQAVLTAYMYHKPNAVLLDYGQTIFGNNRWTLGVEGGCLFTLSSGSKRLMHDETRTSPLFIHSPGKFMECHNKLLDKLQPSTSSHRHLEEKVEANSIGYGSEQAESTSYIISYIRGVICSGKKDIEAAYQSMIEENHFDHYAIAHIKGLICSKWISKKEDEDVRRLQLALLMTEQKESISFEFHVGFP